MKKRIVEQAALMLSIAKWTALAVGEIERMELGEERQAFLDRLTRFVRRQARRGK